MDDLIRRSDAKRAITEWFMERLEAFMTDDDFDEDAVEDLLTQNFTLRKLIDGTECAVGKCENCQYWGQAVKDPTMGKCGWFSEDANIWTHQNWFCGSWAGKWRKR